MRRRTLGASLLILVTIMATVPILVSGQNVSLSIRKFDLLPTRVFQNERVRISVEIENTGGSVANAVQVEVSSDGFTVTNPTSALGDLSSGQRASVQFDAQVRSDAPTASHVAARVSSANGGSFTQTKDVPVQPFTFSVTDPAKTRLTKNEVADIAYNVTLESYEAVDGVQFSVHVDETAFEIVRAGDVYPSIPSGAFKEALVIRSRHDAGSNSYPVEIQLVFTDRVAKESHKFV